MCSWAMNCNMHNADYALVDVSRLASFLRCSVRVSSPAVIEGRRPLQFVILLCRAALGNSSFEVEVALVSSVSKRRKTSSERRRHSRRKASVLVSPLAIPFFDVLVARGPCAAPLGEGDAVQGCVDLAVATPVEPEMGVVSAPNGMGAVPSQRANEALEEKRRAPAGSSTTLAADRGDKGIGIGL